MQAATKGEKGWSVGMETLSTARAADDAGKYNRDDQDENPRGEDDSDPGSIIG